MFSPDSNIARLTLLTTRRLRIISLASIIPRRGRIWEVRRNKIRHKRRKRRRTTIQLALIRLQRGRGSRTRRVGHHVGLLGREDAVDNVEDAVVDQDVLGDDAGLVDEVGVGEEAHFQGGARKGLEGGGVAEVGAVNGAVGTFDDVVFEERGEVATFGFEIVFQGARDGGEGDVGRNEHGDAFGFVDGFCERGLIAEGVDGSKESRDGEVVVGQVVGLCGWDEVVRWNEEVVDYLNESAISSANARSHHITSSTHPPANGTSCTVATLLVLAPLTHTIS